MKGQLWVAKPGIDGFALGGLAAPGAGEKKKSAAGMKARCYFAR